MFKIAVTVKAMLSAIEDQKRLRVGPAARRAFLTVSFNVSLKVMSYLLFLLLRERSVYGLCIYDALQHVLVAPTLGL